MSPAEQYPTAPLVYHSALLGQNRDAGRGWEEQSARSPSCRTCGPQGHRAGLAAAAAPLGCSWPGASSVLRTEVLDRVTLRGKIAQPAPGVLTICFACSQNESSLESFFSSCRNLQSLAHSPVCNFVLHHALFQEVELPMIS